MVVGPDLNERDVVRPRLVNSTETQPFSSCGHAVVQRLMFKEKGVAAFSKEAFYIDATGHGMGCCGVDEKKTHKRCKEIIQTGMKVRLINIMVNYEIINHMDAAGMGKLME